MNRETNYRCCVCKNRFQENQIYEYRWVYFCENHVKEWQEHWEAQKFERDLTERQATEKYKWLDFWDSPVWKINRKIFNRKYSLLSTNQSWTQ